MKKINFVMVCLVVLVLVLCASSVQAADLTGTWNVAVMTSGGSGNPVFTLKQDGDKLSGTYQGRWGEAPCTGSVKGNDFVINFNLGGTDVAYKGKIDGDKMTGTVDFGGQGSGDFTGEKAK